VSFRLAPATVRGRLLLTVLVGVASALALMTVAFNLYFAHSLTGSANRLLRERAEDHLSALTTVDGQLREPGAPANGVIESQVWVFSGGRLIERPRTGGTAQQFARTLAGGPRRTVDVPGDDTRLLAVPIVSGGKRAGTLVAGISLRPYEETRRAALLGSLVLAVVLLGTVGLAAYWLLARALEPVARMTREAAAWSDRDLDRRFALGEPNDELTLLASTLDGLLDRLAASLRRERLFTAELSHELRTPLTRISTQAELALRRDRDPASYRDALGAILTSARQLTRTVETLVTAAREEAASERGTADVYDVALNAADSCRTLSETRNVHVRVLQPEVPIRIGVDADVAERILQPVVENACRYASRHVEIALHRNASKVVVDVADDGTGVAQEEIERIFEPGVRGAAAVRAPEGAGLGLALARRLARAVSGEIAVDTSAGGGRFTIRLPAA
jgi:two-component system OmpR family sensor kinase